MSNKYLEDPSTPPVEDWRDKTSMLVYVAVPALFLSGFITMGFEGVSTFSFAAAASIGVGYVVAVVAKDTRFGILLSVAFAFLFWLNYAVIGSIWIVMAFAFVLAISLGLLRQTTKREKDIDHYEPDGIHGF